VSRSVNGAGRDDRTDARASNPARPPRQGKVVLDLAGYR
jgi:hypothetical protein